MNPGVQRVDIRRVARGTWLALFGVAIAFLLYACWLVIAVDAMAWRPLPTYVQALPDVPQLVLYYYFGEALGPSPAIIENAQFIFLFLSAWGAYGLCILHGWNKDKPRLFFFLILFVGLVLMYYNDRYNFRRVFAGELINWLQVQDTSSRSPIRILIEIGCYAFIAGFMVIAAWLFVRKWSAQSAYAKFFFTCGFVAYFVASVASATRYVFSWYDRVGYLLMNRFPETFAERLAHLPEGLGSHTYPPQFWLMDWWLEESIEYVGAAAFLAFILFSATEFQRRPRS